jgi:selenocysteine-specific elongation factor
MHVIGTAGHVDHGKSTLVEALTGTHPDRLKEEREREMTIDIGFAWLTLPDGEEVGIVDVPGHRDFIENMLAGVGGIDAALFVVAADEGVMPQTREHLAILDLLQIQGGVVALTKIDMMDDPEWLDLVEEDLRRALSGTVLDASPILRVSARSREGLPALRQALGECLAGRPPRPDFGRPRLPVDRIFTIAGFGTVVTGTLIDGSLHAGDEVEVLPLGLKGRVRGLQTHKRKEEAAVPGGRTAVNIGGITVEQIRRGDVLARPGSYRPSRRLDVRFRLLPDASQSVKHNIEVKLFVGAAEVLARLRLIGAEELGPGEEGWLQLELAQEVVVVRGDRYILRRPSPGETLGGGVVLDPHPKGRHKRFSTEVLARLNALAQGTPAEVFFQALLSLGAAPWREAAARSGLEQGAAAQASEELLESGQMIFLEEGPAGIGAQTSTLPDLLVTANGYWEQLSAKVQADLETYHRAYPLKRGMPKEELKSRLKILPRLFNAVLRKLVALEVIKEAGPLLLRPGHEIRFTPSQQRLVDGLQARFAASPYTPPSVKEAQAEAGEEVYNALLELGALVQVAPEVVFRREDYQRMVGEVRRLLQERGTLTAAGVRDHFNTSRKYALALLEHLDSVGMTVREGDARRLKK